MTTNDTERPAPTTLRRLESPAAASLVRSCEIFEELQTVLRCCERLVSELAPVGVGPLARTPDDVVLEAVWTTALLSYGRCFSPDVGDAPGEGGAGYGLTQADLDAAQPEAQTSEWHEVLMRLRDHYADPVLDPRERFSVGLAQDDDGRASGVAITSRRQPLVDDVTVRQTGAIAYALSALVDARITVAQAKLFEDVKATPRSELDELEVLDVLELA